METRGSSFQSLPLGAAVRRHHRIPLFGHKCSIHALPSKRSGYLPRTYHLTVGLFTPRAAGKLRARLRDASVVSLSCLPCLNPAVWYPMTLPLPRPPHYALAENIQGSTPGFSGQPSLPYMLMFMLIFLSFSLVFSFFLFFVFRGFNKVNIMI